MEYDKRLDFFGSFITKNIRDTTIKRFDRLAEGKLKAPSLQELQNKLKSLSKEQKDICRNILLYCIDATTHDFLFQLQEVYDNKGKLEVLYEGENIGSLSDGLHYLIFGDDGWFARFSDYGGFSTEE